MITHIKVCDKHQFDAIVKHYEGNLSTPFCYPDYIGIEDGKIQYHCSLVFPEQGDVIIPYHHFLSLVKP